MNYVFKYIFRADDKHNFILKNWTNLLVSCGPETDPTNGKGAGSFLRGLPQYEFPLETRAAWEEAAGDRVVCRSRRVFVSNQRKLRGVIW